MPDTIENRRILHNFLESGFCSGTLNSESETFKYFFKITDCEWEETIFLYGNCLQLYIRLEQISRHYYLDCLNAKSIN